MSKQTNENEGADGTLGHSFTSWLLLYGSYSFKCFMQSLIIFVSYIASNGFSTV